MKSNKTYSLESRWHIAADRASVWNAVSDAAAWGAWWPALLQARELEAGDAEGRGAYWRFTWRSRLLYRLQFGVRITRLDHLRRMEGSIDGDLAGAGAWTFDEARGVCTVTHSWQVRLNKGWMRALDPLARPVFEWNHHAVMRQGERGLNVYVSRV